MEAAAKAAEGRSHCWQRRARQSWTSSWRRMQLLEGARGEGMDHDEEEEYACELMGFWSLYCLSVACD